MVDALKKPPRKNPLIKTRDPLPPPLMRSRAALSFTARAAEGLFCLQHCTDCSAVFYPARDICPKCWSHNLTWQEEACEGHLLSETTLHNSTNVYFRERLPWRIGTVKTQSGPTVLAHLHSDVEAGGAVRLIARTDKSGQGVIIALPREESENMADDKVLRELSCDPKHRRILITDASGEIGLELARHLLQAGAAKIFLGLAEPWKPLATEAALSALDNVERVPLDVSQTQSVEEAAGSIGGKVDILINTAMHHRPGSPLGRRGITLAQDEMDIHYFGLLRLLQIFGPIMRGRAADGDNNAVAFVNLMSVYALSNWPRYGTSSASEAAAYSLMQSARADFHGSGIKLVNILHGPLEDEWHQSVSPPKLASARLAKDITSALQQGLEQSIVGDVAADIYERWRHDPTVLERELTQLKISD